MDDPHFNLGYHLRRTGLPEPGGDEELRPRGGRVMSQQLDRSKPLWEMWMIEGLSGGRWALLTKVHHSMVDGVSGGGAALGDARRRARAGLRRLTTGSPERQPSGAELAARALAERALSPYEACARRARARRAAPARRAIETAQRAR